MANPDNPSTPEPPGSHDAASSATGLPGGHSDPPGSGGAASPESGLPGGQGDPAPEGAEAADGHSGVHAGADDGPPAGQPPPDGAQAASGLADPGLGDPGLTPDAAPAEPPADEGPGLSLLTEQRVTEVIELMLSGGFRRGQTVRQLAERWGVSPHRAREITAIASHKVRAQVTSPDELAAEVVPGMLTAFHDAVDAKDARGVAALGGQLLEVGGLKTHKTELTGKDGGALQVAGVVLLPPEDPEGTPPA